jgi:signal transduction histidine kinase
VETHGTDERLAPGKHLLQAYSEALGDYLVDPCEDALGRAHEMGRRAVRGGLDVAEMAALHHSSVMKVLLGKLDPADAERTVQTVGALCQSCPAWDLNGSDAAGVFFVHALAPFANPPNDLRKANTALRRLNELREEDARRIAHALHDEAAQLLAAAHLAVEEVAQELGPVQREGLRKVRATLDQIEEDLRRLSHELRPSILDDLGLPAALEFLTQGLSKRAKISIRVECDHECRFPLLVETSLYRIVQESLNNAVKHAHATEVLITLRCNTDAVGCSIRDNGVGFDAEKPSIGRGERGFGLGAMRERAEALGGALSVVSAPGMGTEVFVRIPLRTEDGRESADGVDGLRMAAGRSD